MPNRSRPRPLTSPQSCPPPRQALRWQPAMRAARAIRAMRTSKGKPVIDPVTVALRTRLRRAGAKDHGQSPANPTRMRRSRTRARSTSRPDGPPATPRQVPAPPTPPADTCSHRPLVHHHRTGGGRHSGCSHSCCCGVDAGGIGDADRQSGGGELVTRGCARRLVRRSLVAVRAALLGRLAVDRARLTRRPAVHRSAGRLTLSAKAVGDDRDVFGDSVVTHARDVDRPRRDADRDGGRVDPVRSVVRPGVLRFVVRLPAQRPTRRRPAGADRVG